MHQLHILPQWIKSILLFNFRLENERNKIMLFLKYYRKKIIINQIKWFFITFIIPRFNNFNVFIVQTVFFFKFYSTSAEIYLGGFVGKICRPHKTDETMFAQEQLFSYFEMICEDLRVFVLTSGSLSYKVTISIESIY